MGAGEDLQKREEVWRGKELATDPRQSGVTDLPDLKHPVMLLAAHPIPDRAPHSLKTPSLISFTQDFPGQQRGVPRKCYLMEVSFNKQKGL